MFEKFRRKLIAGLATCAVLFGSCGVWAQTGFAIAQAEDLGFGTVVPEFSIDPDQPIYSADSSGGGGDYFYDSTGNSGIYIPDVPEEPDEPIETDGIPSITIESKNLSYSDSIYILYAVSFDDFDESKNEVKMLFWNGAQEAYTVDTAQTVKSAQYFTNVRSKECIVFYSDGIAAKEMNDMQYCRAYANVNGEIVYSDVVKYSVVDYVYERRADGGLTMEQKNVFNDMLQYGSSAQLLFGYNTGSLANATFYTVKVENGTLEDGFAWGRYANGSMAILTANAPAEGMQFVGWRNANGDIVSKELSYHLYVYAGGTYTAVYEEIPEAGENPASDFSYSSNGTSITITGYHGEATDVVIPATIQGLPVTAIGEYAFDPRGNSGVQSVVIPNGVTTIMASAFESMSSLKSVTLPNTLTTMGMYAFGFCSQLQSITIPLSVTTIQGYVFENCTNLLIYCQAESKPEGWDVNWNYSGCPVAWGGGTEFATFEYTNNGDSITITKFTGIESVVEIPAMIDGLPVTEIGKDAFRTSTRVTKVTIAENVKTIANSAFSGCTSLESVVIGSGVTAIGNYAFSNCNALTSIEIPNGVTSIGNSAFQNCKAMTSITIPASVTTMGQRVFASCTSLSIYCKAESKPEGWDVNWNYSSCPVAWGGGTEFATYEYTNNGDSITITKFMGVETEVEIPATIDGLPVTEIANEAFRANTRVTKVTITENVKTIGDYAFYGCTSLESVVIGSGVTTIGSYAFANCNALTSIAIPDSVTTMGMRIFNNCVKLANVTIGSGLTAIPDYAFYGCKVLATIAIPANVESIGRYAFQNCTVLTAVTLAEGLTTISDYAFSGCKAMTSITIPASVTKMGQKVFANCTALTIYCKVASKPEGWNTNWNYSNCPVAWGGSTEITEFEYSTDGAYATLTKYAGTKTEVEIPSTLGGFPVTAIGDEAFYNNTKLLSVTIPQGVKTIGYRAFSGCQYMTSISMPDGLETIGDYAFNNCRALTSISLPNTLKTIGGNAFYNCASLSVFDIPDSVTTIGSMAFASCTSLSVVTIGVGLANVSSRMFENCRALMEIQVREGNSCYTAVDGIVYTIDRRTLVLYPAGKMATEYSVLPTIEAIGDYAFYNCTKLTSIALPDGLTAIGDYAFQGCSVLKDLEIPNSVTTIGNYALGNCRALTSIEIPGSVTSMGVRVFYNCTNVKTVKFGSGVTAIPDYAFYGCSALVEVTLPNSLTSIGNYAFQNCKTMTSITIPASVTTMGQRVFQNCTSLTIQCEAMEQPEGWNATWNYSNCPVEWGAGGSSEPEVPTVTDEQKVAEERKALFGEEIEIWQEVTGAQSMETPEVKPSVYEDVAMAWILIQDGGIATLENGIFSIVNPTETTLVVLQLVFTCGEASEAFTFYFNVLPAEEPEVPEDSLVPVAITKKPVEGVAYKLYMYQATNNQHLYFTGSMSGYYFATSESYNEGVDIYVSYINDKEFCPYFIDGNGEKQYIGVQEVWNQSRWRIHIVFTPETTSSFVWSDEYKTILTTIPCRSDVSNQEAEADITETFFLGTYNRYNTFSAQKISYATTTGNHVGGLVVMTGNGNTPENPELTDEQKIAEERAIWGYDKDEFSQEIVGAQSTEVPIEPVLYKDVTITWVLVQDGGIATLEKGIFSFVTPTEKTFIALQAIFTCGEVTQTVMFYFNVLPAEEPDVPVEPEVPDLDKVFVERDQLVIEDSVVGETVIILPMNGSIFNEVTFNWQLQEGQEIAYIKGDCLYISNPAETMSVVVQATVLCGDEVLTREFCIKVQSFELPDPNNPDAIIDAASKLENGQVLPGGEYTITGVVTRVITAWDATYGNITVEMSVGEKIMQCYRLTSGEADASVLKIGDTITVTGSIKNYNGIVEFDRGCRLVAAEYAELTDSYKVAAEKEYWEGGDGEVEGAQSVQLPANGMKYADVAITWKIAEDPAGIATLENNFFAISNPTEKTTVVLEATFTCGEAVDGLKFFFTVNPKVEPEIPEVTDEQKVAEERAAWVGEETESWEDVTGANSTELPAVDPMVHKDVSIAWVLAQDGGIATLDNRTFSIVNPAEKTVVAVQLVFTCGEASEVFTFYFTVYPAEVTEGEIDGLEYYGNGSEMTITKYVGEDTNVVIPATIEGLPVTAIGEHAFERTSVNTVEIPTTVTKIGDYAFANSSLTTFNFYEGLKEIGSFAFQSTKLTSVSLPASLKVLGKSAFRQNTAITSITFADGIQITEIPNGAFEGCSNTKLTTLEIPALVETIGSKAFYNCKIGLLNFAGGNLTYIGHQAFYGFTLTTLALPEGLTTLEGNVFQSMTKLTTIVLPSTLSTLNNEDKSGQMRFVFDGLTGLTTIEVREGSPYFMAKDGVLYSADGKELVYHPIKNGGTTRYKYIIPEGVETIGEYAFYKNTYLNGVVLTPSVTSIGKNAFNGCTYITSVDFARSGDTTLSIGDGAFQGCLRLNGKTVDGRNVFTIPETVMVDGERVFQSAFGSAYAENLYIVFEGNNNTTALNNTFYSCTGIVGVENIPSNLTVMMRTFYGCTNLASVTFSNEQGTIDQIAGAFYGCKALTSINLPNVGSMTSGVQPSAGTWKPTTGVQGAFEGCTALQTVSMAGCELMGYSTFKGCTALMQIVLPENLTSIGAGSFYGCTSLTEIDIPEGVKAIPEYAFGNCTALKKVGVHSSVTEIGESAFEGCTALEEMSMPAEIATIGARAFYGCSALAEIALNGVQSVGEYAFYGCKALQRIEIPASLKTVSAYAFAECVNVTKVTVMEGVEVLGDYAFANCASVVEFVLPSTVKTIGESVFSGWTALQSFAVSGEYYVSQNGIVYNADYTQMLFVSPMVKGELVVPETITNLAPAVFAGTEITSIILPDSIKEIPSRAFYNCTYLTNVKMPANLERIGDMAFQGCTSLKGITIPKTVHSVFEKVYFEDASYGGGYYIEEAHDGIGHGAFYGCTSLENVVFEEGGTQRLSFGDFAFYNCTSLKGAFNQETGEYAFVIPSRVRGDAIPADAYADPEHLGSGNGHHRTEQGVGMYAFARCTALTKVVFADEAVEGLAETLILSIGAFQECTALQSVIFGNTLGNISVAYFDYRGTRYMTTLAAIGDNVFQGCSALTSVVFTDTANVYAAQTAFTGLNVDLGSLTLVAGSDGYDYGAGKVDWRNNTLRYLTINGCTDSYCNKDGCKYYDPHNGIFLPEDPWSVEW